LQLQHVLFNQISKLEKERKLLKVDFIIQILKMLNQDEISMTFSEPVDDEKFAQLSKICRTGAEKFPPRMEET